MAETLSFRSSHRRCSVRKGILRNFTKFTGKHLGQSLFFSCEFCEISKNTFLQNTSERLLLQLKMNKIFKNDWLWLFLLFFGFFCNQWLFLPKMLGFAINLVKPKVLLKNGSGRLVPQHSLRLKRLNKLEGLNKVQRTTSKNKQHFTCIPTYPSTPPFLIPFLAST